MAGRIALDLKKFKHVKSDKNTTTLRHQDGHEMTILHNKLGLEFKAQLSALSKGPQQAMTPDQADEAKHQKMAEGGEVKYVEDSKPILRKYAEGSGKVAIPAGSHGDTDSGTETPTEVGKKMGQGSESESGTAGFSKMWKNAKQIAQHPSSMLAKGGEVAPNMYAEGEDVDIGGVKQIVPDRIPGPAVDYNPQPDIQGDVGFTPEDFGRLIGAAAHAVHKAKEKASEAVSEAGKGVSEGVKETSGIDLSGKDEEPPAQLPPQAQEAPQAAQQPTPAAAPAEQSEPQPEQPGKIEATIPGAERALISGIEQQQQAQKGIGQQAGNIAEQRANEQAKASTALQNVATEYKNTFNELNQEREAHIHDMQQGFVDPEKYWQNHSKMAAGIGMILAGFNPTSNPNAAVNFLKFQMEQNLDAQKQNLQAKNNILAATMKQFDNVHMATEMARVIQQDAAAHQILAAAPQAQNALAQQQAKLAAGQLLADSSAKLQQLAQYKTMMNIVNPKGQPSADNEESWQQRNQVLNLVNPEMAKYRSERHVPGVGDASIPVPDNAKSQMRAYKDVNNTMNQVLDFSKQHAGSLDPRVVAQGNTLINQLQSQIRVAEDQGVYKKSDADFLRETIGRNPASPFSAFSTEPKVKILQQLKQGEYNNLLGQYGLKPQQLSKPQQEPQYKTVNGVKYMRGPNGEAIRVK